MREKYVLDACAVIAFLNDEDGANRVEQLLSQGDRAPNTLFMHEINLLEIYYGVYRDEGKEIAEQTYVKVFDLPIKFVTGLRENVFKEAGRLKTVYKISLADSIALSEFFSLFFRMFCGSDRFEFNGSQIAQFIL